MKTRDQKSTEPERKQPAEQIRTVHPERVDELGVQRGQNGEKGNTTKPENVRDEKEAAH